MRYVTPKFQTFTHATVATLNLHDVHHAVCTKHCENYQTLEIVCQI